MEWVYYLLGNDLYAAGFIILNLILIESLLSIDNAAVLATMVMDLPKEQRAKALKYGIIGAYFFRGLCLVFAAWLVTIWWLKVLGGLYLLYLCFDYFHKKASKSEENEEENVNKEQSFIYRNTVGLFGKFWATVILVELMDLAFSIDNVFAAVAFTDNLFLICTGVFIGILAMRFVAQSFVVLMEHFPFLETAAYVVIGILGVKLSTALYSHNFPQHELSKFLESEHTDLYVSILTVAVFVVPVLWSLATGSAKKPVEELEKN